MIRTHQSILARVPEGSGLWFLEAQEFVDWRWGRHKLLWCSGIRKSQIVELSYEGSFSHSWCWKNGGRVRLPIPRS